MNCLRRNTCCQSKRLDWEGHPGRQQQGQRAQENCSATWFAVSEFMVVGSLSGWSLASHPDSPPILPGVHTLFSWDGFQQGGFWEVGRTCGVSFWFFPNSSPCSLFLTRTTCCKITHANSYNGAWPGWVVSVSASPDKRILVIMMVTIFWVLTMCQAMLSTSHSKSCFLFTVIR